MMIKKTLYFLIVLSYGLLIRAQAPPSYTNVTFGQPIRQNIAGTIKLKYNKYYKIWDIDYNYIF